MVNTILISIKICKIFGPLFQRNEYLDLINSIDQIQINVRINDYYYSIMYHWCVELN